MIDDYLSSLLLELDRRGEARFSELKRTINNPRTLSRKLKLLSSLQMIKSGGNGYFLSKRGKKAAKLVKKWIDLLERPKVHIKNIDYIPHHTYAEVLERYCRILLSHFKNRLVGALVFGSVARGDWTSDSDIDLLVVVEDWKVPVWERTRELSELIDELQRTGEYQRAVERGFIPTVQHYPLDREEAESSHRIYIDACIDGVILFETDNFLTRTLDDFRKRMTKLGARRIYLPKGYYWDLWNGEAGEVFEL